MADGDTERMKLLGIIDGAEHVIETPSSGNGAAPHYYIGDAELEADVREVEPGVYSVLLHSHSYEVRIENGEDQMYALVNGRRLPVEIRDPRRMAHRSGGIQVAGAQTVCSPMPGKVVRVLVAPGEEVEAGRGLLVVEAMKMQNEIKSPKAGRVAAIHVKEGSAVSGGEAMIVVE